MAQYNTECEKYRQGKAEKPIFTREGPDEHRVRLEEFYDYMPILSSPTQSTTSLHQDLYPLEKGRNGSNAKENVAEKGDSVARRTRKRRKLNSRTSSGRKGRRKNDWMPMSFIVNAKGEFCHPGGSVISKPL